MPDLTSYLRGSPPSSPTLKECLIEACLSARNGFEYAAKLRLAHCVVMTTLYGGHRTLGENLEWILQSTREHGITLGTYAFVYKLLRSLMDRSMGSVKLNPAVAGFVAAYFTWGQHRSAISYQVGYITKFSRNDFRTFPCTGTSQVSYGRSSCKNDNLIELAIPSLRYLFVVDKGSLQSSLRQAMEFIYDTHDQPFTGFRDIFPFLRRPVAVMLARPSGDVNDVLEDVLENVDPEEF